MQPDCSSVKHNEVPWHHAAKKHDSNVASSPVHVYQFENHYKCGTKTSNITTSITKIFSNDTTHFKSVHQRPKV